MPELPEVEALARFLADEAGGRRVERVALASFAALKTVDPSIDSLVGAVLERAERRGKFLCLGFGGAWLVLHLARAGWVQWKDPLPAGRPKPSPRNPIAVRVGFEGGAGFDVTEAGTEKRLAAYVVRDPAEVEGVARLGPEPLGLGPGELGERLRSHPGRLKAVLADQEVVAGIGNAYSDEILHAARMSPFKPTAKLGDDEVAVLHEALVGVLADALERSAGLPAAGLKSEKRSGLRVHGRTGQPCPVCGDTVREVSYATKSFQYCPTCQTGGKPLADRRMSRLLK